jgi:hypothetical protein
MEFVSGRLLKVSIIDRKSNRICLDPKETPENVVEQKIKEAITKGHEVRW